MDPATASGWCEMDPLSINQSVLPGVGNESAGNRTELQLLHFVYWGWWLEEIGTTAIFIVGLIGNTLSFLVMRTKQLRKRSYSFYLCSLAIFDSLSLFFKFLRRIDSMCFVLFGAHGSLYKHFTDGGCKVYKFTEHLCFLMSSWLIVCITIERFVAVYFPFKRLLCCRPQRLVTWAVTLSLIVILSYTQVFRLIFVQNTGDPKEYCGDGENFLQLSQTLHTYWYLLVLENCLPIGIITICNIMILHKIKRVENLLLQEGGTRHLMRIYTKKHKTTLMLVGISFAFIITHLPPTIVTIYLSCLDPKDPHSPCIFASLKTYYPPIELVTEINYCINFFIYVATGEAFRHQVKLMFAACFRRSRYRRAHHKPPKVLYRTITGPGLRPSKGRRNVFLRSSTRSTLTSQSWQSSFRSGDMTSSSSTNSSSALRRLINVWRSKRPFDIPHSINRRPNGRPNGRPRSMKLRKAPFRRRQITRSGSESTQQDSSTQEEVLSSPAIVTTTSKLFFSEPECQSTV